MGVSTGKAEKGAKTLTANPSVRTVCGDYREGGDGDCPRAAPDDVKPVGLLSRDGGKHGKSGEGGENTYCEPVREDSLNNKDGRLGYMQPEEELGEVTDGSAGGVALGDEPLEDTGEVDGNVLGDVRGGGMGWGRSGAYESSEEHHEGRSDKEMLVKALASVVE
jgi:hypothetical protein